MPEPYPDESWTNEMLAAELFQQLEELIYITQQQLHSRRERTREKFVRVVAEILRRTSVSE